MCLHRTCLLLFESRFIGFLFPQALKIMKLFFGKLSVKSKKLLFCSCYDRTSLKLVL